MPVRRRFHSVSNREADFEASKSNNSVHDRQSTAQRLFPSFPLLLFPLESNRTVRRKAKDRRKKRRRAEGRKEGRTDGRTNGLTRERARRRESWSGRTTEGGTMGGGAEGREGGREGRARIRGKREGRGRPAKLSGPLVFRRSGDRYM